MLRTLVLCAMIACGSGAAANTESLRQYHAETSTEAETIVATLQRQLPKSVALAETESGAMVHYSGNMTPAPLAEFLKAGFDNLDPAVVAPGKTVSMTLMLTDLGQTTEMSLMLLARFPTPTVPLLEGGQILMDGTAPGACNGHMVIHHALPPEEAAPAYREHLQNQGFAFEEEDAQETSFFVGYRPGCSLALYLQEEQGTSLIVIRYLED